MSNKENSSNKDVKCYAAVIGNCSNVQSREHWMTQGLFKGKFITVSGQSWAADEPKTVSKKTLGKRILCEAHNNELSKLDKAGIKFFRALDEFQEKANKRRQLKRSAFWNKDVYDFDGTLIERWMCKTAVGSLSENANGVWHLNGKDYLNPPQEIIESIFGINKLQPPMGMYMISARGDKIRNDDFAGFLHNVDSLTKGYLGGIFSVRRFQFLVYLDNRLIEKNNFYSSTNVLFGKEGETPLFHPKQLKMIANNKISGVINLQW